MEKQVKINSGKLLSKLLEQIVNDSLETVKNKKNEGVKSTLYHNGIEEKERQASAESSLDEEDDDLFGGADGGDEAPTDEKPAEKDQETPTVSKTIDDEKEKLAKGEISSEDVVDKLNTIRSGKSFKDSAISGRLKEYVDSLSKAEKVALLAFLKGIAQIVTGEFEADQAVDPGDDPADVSMQKGKKKQTKTVKPNVIKAPEKEKKNGPPAEDTSAPAPIKPVKK